MKLFDAHVHLWPNRLHEAIWQWFDEHAWQIRYKIYADQAVQQLTERGIDGFLVLNYAHKAGMAESLNEWTYDFCKSYPQAVPLGAIHPDDEKRDNLLERCFNEYGFSGIKFHCHVSAIRPDDERMFPIYEKLIEHDKLIVLHAGIGPSLRGYKETTKDISGVRFVEPALKRYPQLKMIMPHLGADEVDEFFDLMDPYPNLWLDTTMVVAGFFPLEIPWDKIEKYSDRILYGSDFPHIPYDLMTEINVIRNAPITEIAKARLLSENAQRLLQRP